MQEFLLMYICSSLEVQTSFDLVKDSEEIKDIVYEKKHVGNSPVYRASEDELREHREFCEKIDKDSEGSCIWNISKF